MNDSIINILKKLNQEYKIIKNQLNQINNLKSNIINQLLERYDFLRKLHINFHQWKIYEEEIDIIQSLLKDDCDSLSLQKELTNRCKLKKQLEQEIIFNLIHKDPNDIHNCLLEIHAGTGGNEASLFVETLFKMYSKYAESKKWKIEIINIHNNNYKGYKEIIMRIIGQNAYGQLKFESGGHRVQRIPITETQGRIHTSTCTVAVLPDLPDKLAIKIHSTDLKIDTFKSSGAGGQHVNTTDSAIRITHIPTGIVVECQNERSQHKNKHQALTILKARIMQLNLDKKQKELSLKKKNLLGSGERSFRNRTYNYSQGRITDHRINLNIYDLESVLNGKLELLISPIINYYNYELLKIKY